MQGNSGGCAVAEYRRGRRNVFFIHFMWYMEPLQRQKHIQSLLPHRRASWRTYKYNHTPLSFHFLRLFTVLHFDLGITEQVFYAWNEYGLLSYPCLTGFIQDKDTQMYKCDLDLMTWPLTPSPINLNLQIVHRKVILNSVILSYLPNTASAPSCQQNILLSVEWARGAWAVGPL